ncbi:ABC transporter ATP-binding protein [Brevibacillus sp. B_LB10_24]|uniref:ABC transporter ATP-binding protein n=1 Tax=Brevibacillus sp. B_LB10_24 TaxID=3380645 RepID=UPI0038BA53E7
MTILGPSGSGKTTLLKLTAGFDQLTSGKIHLNGQEITRKKPYERNIGMLFQNYALFPHMTVAQNIAYPLKIRKFTKQQVDSQVRKMLEMVHLEEFADRYPGSLSGGQQQRVALARAIVFNPPLLLLDEPLGALDKNLREKMQLEIKQIHKKIGMTTISVTHDQMEALTMSDRICVMNKGRIEQVDSPEAIYQKPKNRFVAEFIGEINLFKGHVTAREKNRAVVKLSGFEDFVCYTEEQHHQVGENVYVALRPENVNISTERSGFDNNLRVTVAEKIYVGDALKVKTRTAFGEEVTIKAPNQLHSLIEVGRDIHLGWDNACATTIPCE